MKPFYRQFNDFIKCVMRFMLAAQLKYLSVQWRGEDYSWYWYSTVCTFIDIPIATINDSIIYHPPVGFVMDKFIEHKNKDDTWYKSSLLYTQWKIPHVS